MSAMPWGALLRAAARMGIPPEAFWRMSLAEWRLMAGAGANAAMTRAELEEMERCMEGEHGGSR
ncbi:MAG: phage tail assembly chaperone [Alphaproteobacteria bacterium]|nr:phage tail assembly chaperone [Alphaproteobacteria bacterium]